MRDMLAELAHWRTAGEGGQPSAAAYNAKGAMLALRDCLSSSKIFLSLLTITQRWL